MSAFLFVSSTLLPFVMALIGARFRRSPPMKVNWFYGYRTSLSMKSQEAWDYANRRMGEVWWRTGLVAGGASVLVAAFCWAKLETVALWLVGFQLLLMLFTIVVVERDLRREFDSEGHPRNR